MTRTDIAPGYTRFSVSYQDLSAASTTQHIQLLFNPPNGPVSIVTPQPFQLYIGSVMIGVRIIPVVSFGGGSLSAMTLGVGTTGDDNRFSGSAFDVFQAPGPTVLQETTEFKSGSTGAVPVTVTFTSTSDNVNAATAGQVDVYLYYIGVPTSWA